MRCMMMVHTMRVSKAKNWIREIRKRKRYPTRSSGECLEVLITGCFSLCQWNQPMAMVNLC